MINSDKQKENYEKSTDFVSNPILILPPMNACKSFLLLVGLSLITQSLCLEMGVAEDDANDFFEKQVRPLLVAKCLECHGDDEPESGLRLTSREKILKGGDSGPAAVERISADSLLIQAIRRQGKLKMPPDEKLGEAELAALTRWVEIGLPWPASSPLTAPKKAFVISQADRQHWAFRPIADPDEPAVADNTWPRTSLDRFVLAKLEAANLKPAPPADRRTLIRRAYYDLIGLPPTWEEVQAFVADPATTEDAFAGVVDHLLASPRYGERWARHWLDVARFADTKDGVLMYGDERIRPYAYTYRDYVIRALNEDLPFDRFVQEQLAADLIEPKVEPWRLAAMGFLTLGRMYDGNIHDIIDDQIDTVSRGLLGLTVSCARCHDHKYDPVPTADYYSLYGVFASSEAPLELPLADAPENITGGVEFEKQAELKREELRKFLDEQFDLLSETARQRAGDYLVHVVSTKPDPLETAIFFLSLAPEDLRPPIVARWRQYLEQRATADDPVFGPWHDLLAIAVAESLPAEEPAGEHAESTNQAESFAEAAAKVLEQWKSRPAGTESGQLNPLVREALVSATLSDRVAVACAYGDLLKKVYEQSKLPTQANTDVAVVNASDDPASQQVLEILVSRESPTYFPKSRTRRYMSREQTDAFGGKVKELDLMVVKSPNAPPRAMAVYDIAVPYEPKIFVRGNPTQEGAPVPRQFLEILATGKREPFPHGSGRLDVSQAITSPQNPLTARVIVNRVWMYHFGEPLVTTPSDFGKRSLPPSHPELLDHLASRFIQEGWSLKKMHHWIMTSQAYQQASSVEPDVLQHSREIDPENRWLWRMHRQRLDIESMRDTLLAVSGRLEHRLGGRPVDIAGDPQNRCRTIYGLVDRQSLPSVFRAFDFASPDQSSERRPRTMVPQQALFALNSPFVVEQAKSLAARPEIAALEGPVQKITAIYRAVFAREPSRDELVIGLEFVGVGKAEQSQLSMWQQFVQVLLSSNEFMYLD